MANVQVKLSLRNTGLNSALKAKLAMARRNTAALPDYLANKACQFISWNAYQQMPRVEASTIATELNQAVELVKTKGGKRFLRGQKFQRGHRIFGAIGPDRAYKPEYASVPLLALIINARANPASRYNIRTGSVYATSASPFRGKSRAAGAAAMLESMRRVFAARMSSMGFFAAVARAVNVGFKMSVDRFKAFGSSNEMEGFMQKGGADVNKASSLLAKGLAQVLPARGGSGHARFTVATTEPDTKGDPGGALFRIAQPVWQQAVDNETVAIRAEVERRYVEAMKKSGFVVK